MKSYLIFSDLDGTFLHHQNYSYGKNDLVIIPIPCFLICIPPLCIADMRLGHSLVGMHI